MNRIIILAIVLCLVQSTLNAQKDHGLLKFGNKDALYLWASANLPAFDVSDVESIETKEQELLIIRVDYCSGISMLALYVFIRDVGYETWDLICFRRTNTSQIQSKYLKDQEKIVFTSKAGVQLLEFSTSNLNLNIDPSEQ